MSKEMSDLILSHGDQTDGTAYPFWYIAKKVGLGRTAILAGIWFSRDAANEHLDSHRYRYPRTAFVYCASGHMSYDYRKLLELAKEEREG